MKRSILTAALLNLICVSSSLAWPQVDKDHPNFPLPQAPSSMPQAPSSDCSNVSRYDIASPHINISEVKHSGGILGDHFIVVGTVEGVCLSEAGYFENEMRVIPISVNQLRSFGRFPFNIRIDASKNPEVRVYTVTGDRAVTRIDPAQYGVPVRPLDPYAPTPAPQPQQAPYAPDRSSPPSNDDMDRF